MDIRMIMNEARSQLFFFLASVVNNGTVIKDRSVIDTHLYSNRWLSIFWVPLGHLVRYPGEVIQSAADRDNIEQLTISQPILLLTCLAICILHTLSIYLREGYQKGPYREL